MLLKVGAPTKNLLRAKQERTLNAAALIVTDLFQQLGVKRTDMFCTCLTCADFVEETSMCRIAKAVPPPRVIADGCEKYTDNCIPF